MSDSAEEAKHAAKYPYSFCEDGDMDSIIASVWSTHVHGPWESAKSLAHCTSHLSSVNATMNITADKDFLKAIQVGYADDAWCQTLPSAVLSLPNLTTQDNLWYVGG